MARALTPTEPALTGRTTGTLGSTMDMTPPETIKTPGQLPTTAATAPADIGFDVEGGRVLPPVEATPISAEERRSDLMHEFNIGLGNLEAELNEKLGGDPVKVNVDDKIFAWQEGPTEGLGQWGHKDEIYQRALGYVPLAPNALTSEEKAAVDRYASQLKGELLQEKKAKIQLKNKYINQYIEIFKQALKNEQDRREITEVQALRKEKAEEKAEKERLSKEKEARLKKSTEEKTRIAKDREARLKKKAEAPRPKKKLTRTQALKEIARVQREIAKMELIGDDTTDHEKYLTHLKGLTGEKEKPKQSNNKRNRAIGELKRRNKPVTEKNINFVMERM